MGNPFESATDAEMEAAYASMALKVAPNATSCPQDTVRADSELRASTELSSARNQIGNVKDVCFDTLQHPKQKFQASDPDGEVKNMATAPSFPNQSTAGVPVVDNNVAKGSNDDAVDIKQFSPPLQEPNLHHNQVPRAPAENMSSGPDQPTSNFGGSILGSIQVSKSTDNADDFMHDSTKNESSDDALPKTVLAPETNTNNTDDDELFVTDREDSVDIKLEEDTTGFVDLTQDEPPSNLGQASGSKVEQPIVIDDDDYDGAKDDHNGGGSEDKWSAFIDIMYTDDDDDDGDGEKPIIIDDVDEPNVMDTDDHGEVISMDSADLPEDESGDYQPDTIIERDDKKPSHKKQATGRKKAKSPTRSKSAKHGHNMTREQLAEYDMLQKEIRELNASKQQFIDKLTSGHVLSASEQQRMPTWQKRIEEIQMKLKCMSKQTNGGKTSGASPASTSHKSKVPKKGKMARTARQWFARDNETRKGIIKKKRKLLRQEPVPAIQKPQKGNKARENPPKYVDRMADGMEHIKNRATLSVSKLQFSNPMQARMARTEVEDPEDFTASTKAEQLARHSKNVPDDLDAETIKADRRRLDRASKTFGLNKCKAINNRWAIDGMQTPLMNHQILGVSWMLERECGEDKGGINADEMGMGKTIQTIATIVSNPPTQEDHDKGRRTTLIVVPSSLVTQWMEEIRRHAEPSHLEDIHHYKASKNDDSYSLRKKDILVTTYNEVLNAYLPKAARKHMESKECSKEEEQALLAENLGFLFKVPFYRVVLDECHAIKNPNSQTSMACRTLDATYRWGLSGTPIQNRIEEIWPYLSFLRVDWAPSLHKLRQKVGNLENKHNKKSFEAIVKEVIQRRIMNDMLLGKRIYSIPECYEEVISFPLTKEEQIIYRTVEERFRKIINFLLRKLKKAGRAVKLIDLEIYIVFLTRLRQATAHPFLIEPALKTTLKQEDLEKIAAGLLRHSGQAGVIDQIREWRTRNLDAKALRNLATPDSTNFGIGRFGHEFDMEEHIQMAMASQNAETCNICFKTLTAPTVADCDHFFCRECIEHEQMVAIQKNLENALCPECDKPLVNIRPRDESSISLDDDGDGDDNASSIAGGSQSWGSDTERDFRRFQKLQERSRASRETMVEDDYGRVLGNDMLGQQPRLKKENTMFLRASDKRYPEPMVPSAKTTMVKEIVLRWQSEAPEDKVIIFTQFLEESQIIGRMLQSENMSFLYFYGDMGQKKKQKALEKFRTEPSAKVLIASLKCGGVGLNITCANRVILTDPWWNAAIELQACARVFRIGQSKKTHFVSLLVENTIDGRIASLQAEKLRNIEEAMQHSRTASIEEMASLFGHLKEDDDGCLFIEADYKD